ncbi:MAG: FtsX-like permease family protein [Acidimicrobiia bacterium]
MRIAFRELVRRPSRFVTAVVILTLIASLLMLLGGLLDGLISQSTGAIYAQRGDLIVYSSTAENSFLRSRITAEERARIQAVPGVTAVSGLSVVQLGARVPERGARDLANVAIFGTETPPKGVVTIPPRGQGIADDTLKANGVKRGMTILLGPARAPVTIVGFVSGTAYEGQRSVWASPETWRDVQSANRPDARLAPGASQALVVQTKGSATEVAKDIDQATTGATTTLTVDAAARALPGVEQQESVFNQIIGVTVVVAIVVVALFFALLTVERTALYGVLKAIGARSRTLFAGVVLQAVIVTIVACGIGGALAVLLQLLIPPGSIPYQLTGLRGVTSAAYLLIASIVGCAFSLRRVLRIDPASAIGSGS